EEVANGTVALTEPVAGLNTSPWRSEPPGLRVPPIQWEMVVAVMDIGVLSRATRTGRVSWVRPVGPGTAVSEEPCGELAAPGAGGVGILDQLEQVDELLTGVVVVLDLREQRVESGVEVAGVGQPSGARQRRDPTGGGRLGDAFEQGQALFGPAGRSEERRGGREG